MRTQNINTKIDHHVTEINDPPKMGNAASVGTDDVTSLSGISTALNEPPHFNEHGELEVFPPSLHRALHDATVEWASEHDAEVLGLWSEPGALAPFMRNADFLTWQIQSAALNTLLNREPRNFSEIARSLGVTPAAISVAYTRLVNQLGFGRCFRKAETRRKMSESATRAHAEKRRAA
jgi:hypothetical protein